jgi:beta-lactamase class A
LDQAAINQSLQTLPGSTSVYIILPDGQTIGNNPNRVQPSASIIKLWISATAYEEAKAGRLNLAEAYTVKSSDIASGTGILANNVGKTYTYGQIISTMLTFSDNSAANIVIRKIGGFERINSYILRNQYGATKIQRFLGDVSNPRNNFTSGKDAATYLLRLSRGEIVDGNSSSLILSALRDRKNYNADQNFFSTKLTAGYQLDGYVHMSGTGTRVRNEIGLVPLLNSSNIIIAILDMDMPDEGAAENAISSAVQVISQAVKS